MVTFLPTPIGNLGDISFRTIQILKEGEIILCEDTRVAKKLIQLLSIQHNIEFPQYQFISVHSHNEKSFLNDQIKQMFELKNCIYMSDAGMPCVSDPGSFLVDFCLENKIEFDVIPGANALLTAYASSGFSNTQFSFFGFLPHKGQDRANQLNQILQNPHLSILYESPHRLLKLLEELNQKAPQRVIFLTKELTKMYQKRYKGFVCDIYATLQNESIKGEWVVILQNDTSIQNTTPISLEDIKELSIPPKQKSKLIAKLTGKNIKEIYNSLLE